MKVGYCCTYHFPTWASLNFLKGEEEEKWEKLKQQGFGKLFILPRALFHFCPSLIQAQGLIFKVTSSWRPLPGDWPRFPLAWFFSVYALLCPPIPVSPGSPASSLSYINPHLRTCL